ncbi:response regulator [Hymenobacter persicinus]|uniref:Response regulator n=1 Tax=Hymenobacter persicinus TaxID=2025506 RepID=A0A4Q5L7M6_9BACT|nr:response regulator [Hymenobacter persicinus]RYU77198.1 response regulator [Hymenobacter persicinus]
MKTILLIEDNRQGRENTAEILALAGYAVVQAANGKQGVAAARQQRPDLILCDIMMPELDGYGVLHILGQDPTTAGIPFVFLTAKSNLEDFRKGMNNGADDYLTKPFDGQSLLLAVELRFKKQSSARPPLPPAAAEPSLAELHALLTAEHRMRAYKKRTVLFQEGDAPAGVYFIHSGKVKTFKTDEGGNEYVTSLSGAGDYVGHLNVLEDMPYANSASTLEDCVISFFPLQEFRTLLAQHPGVARQFAALLSQNLAAREQQLLRLAYHSVRKRLADALIHYQQLYHPGPAAAPPELLVSREYLAGVVGASKETISRVLSKLRDAHLIDISGSRIIIPDLEKLRRIRV